MGKILVNYLLLASDIQILSEFMGNTPSRQVGTGFNPNAVRLRNAKGI